MLLFPSLITELCKRAKVKEYPRDNWISMKTPIYPLNMHSQGAPSKRKKKIDLGKSVDDDIDPCWPFIAGSFDKLSNEIRSIRELIFGLLTGLEEPSTNRHRKLHRLTMIDFQHIRRSMEPPSSEFSKTTFPWHSHIESYGILMTR